MEIFRGAGVALITPMNADFSVNFDKLEELVEEQVTSGTDAIISCGTTGEASTLSEEEHLEVIRRTVKAVNGRIPVIAGTGSNSTKTAIELSKGAEEAGADGLLLVTPYYNKATQGGLIRHYTCIAESVGIPCILYNIPSRTGVTIQPETMAELYKNVSNIVGMKDSTGSITMTAKLMTLVDKDFCLYSGDDDEIVPILSLGGRGVISVLSNIAPRQTHDICADWFAGNIDKSREGQLRAFNLVKALFSEVNPIPVKTAMNLLGKDVGPLRLPLTEMEEKNKKTLLSEMKKYGLL